MGHQVEEKYFVAKIAFVLHSNEFEIAPYANLFPIVEGGFATYFWFQQLFNTTDISVLNAKCYWYSEE